RAAFAHLRPKRSRCRRTHPPTWWTSCRCCRRASRTTSARPRRNPVPPPRRAAHTVPAHGASPAHARRRRSVRDALVSLSPEPFRHLGKRRPQAKRVARGEGANTTHCRKTSLAIQLPPHPSPLPQRRSRWGEGAFQADCLSFSRVACSEATAVATSHG